MCATFHQIFTQPSLHYCSQQEVTQQTQVDQRMDTTIVFSLWASGQTKLLENRKRPLNHVSTGVGYLISPGWFPGGWPTTRVISIPGIYGLRKWYAEEEKHFCWVVQIGLSSWSIPASPVRWWPILMPKIQSVQPKWELSSHQGTRHAFWVLAIRAEIFQSLGAYQLVQGHLGHSCSYNHLETYIKHWLICSKSNLLLQVTFHGPLYNAPLGQLCTPCLLKLPLCQLLKSPV